MKIENLSFKRTSYFSEVVEWLRKANRGERIRISELSIEFTGVSSETIFQELSLEVPGDVSFSVSRGDNSPTAHSYIIMRN